MIDKYVIYDLQEHLKFFANSYKEISDKLGVKEKTIQDCVSKKRPVKDCLIFQFKKEEIICKNGVLENK